MSRTHNAPVSSWSSRAPARSSPGRVCSEIGCPTVLSIYNTTPECSMHEVSSPPRGSSVIRRPGGSG